MSPIAHLLAASAAFTLAAVGAAAAQNYSLAPTFGVVNLTAGFTPDPNVVSVQSGGNVDASALNNQAHVGNCTGMIADAPDVRLNYTSGDFQRLIISVNASADTTLVINAPDGSWHCDDDGGAAGLNPSLTFAPPRSGQYDIWIGTYGNASLQPAALHISELTSQ